VAITDTISIDAGPDPDGRIHVNLGGQPWTGLELAEAFAFVISLYLGLAFEVEAANAEGRTVDVPECLQREALAIAADPVTGPFTGAYVDEPPGQDPW
jgi:hypothetical protein